MMRGIHDWLDALDLGRYTETFTDNEIDLAALPHITEEDLRDLGVALGARRKILAAIAALDNIDGAPAGSRSSDVPAGAPAERRRLTVMFCDLVGSTALASGMDPEEYRDLLAVYRTAVSKATQVYDGYIAAHMGDGLLIYFGYPHAHEDDPERAVRAGLDVVEAVGNIRHPDEPGLQVRIGIATGLVVAGDMLVEGAAEQRAVLGETPNLAARLQAVAEPNTVVLSDSTRRRIEGRFVIEAQEPRFLKGIADKVTPFRAFAVKDTSRFEAIASLGLTAMAGRESELMLLTKRWEQALAGEGQAVLLGGEPGIGKSRICEQLRLAVGEEAADVLRYQCSPYHTDSAFHPIIDHLHRAAGIVPGDSLDQRREKVTALAGAAMPEHETAAPLLHALISLPPADEAPPAMTPQRQKAETIGVLLKLLEHWSRGGPVLMIFEDAHWIDPSTSEALDAMIRQLQSLRILCLVTHRPEYSPPWSGIGHLTTLSLNRLGRRDVDRIVRSVTGGKNLPKELVERIAERTDGVPLFVEELTKTVLESEVLEEDGGEYVLAGSLPGLSVPATLHDSLIERLDRLAHVREVAQTAACIGRAFSPELLADALEMEQNRLDSALAQLVEAGLVFRQDVSGQAGYSFKHALVRDAAYESVLVSKRQQVHARIAQALEAGLDETSSSEPELIARHYTAANMPEKAIPFWMTAGRRALAGSNLVEANSHFSTALKQTSKIEKQSRRAAAELDIRTALGTAIMALNGWPSPEVFEVVQPACDLFDQGYGTSDDFMNFWNLWVHHGCRAEHREGLAVVERMQKHAKARGEPVLQLISAFTASMAHFWVGDYELARSNEATALGVYDFERDRNLVWNYNHDPQNTLLSWSALRVWASGCPDQARLLSDMAVEHARRVRHPFNLCWTLGNSSAAYGLSGDYEEAFQRIDELRRIAQEQELIFIEAYMAPVNTCIVAAQKGDYELAYDEGARGEDVWKSIGGRFWSPIVRAHMSLACLELGRHEEARKIINETVAQMEDTGELMLAEEIYRIGGLVQLDGGKDREAARALFDKSLEISRQHGTRSFELRTAISLASLMRDQGRHEQAVELLATVYKQFTEGFETADLKKARTLIKELA